jgi:hypothetical protein
MEPFVPDWAAGPNLFRSTGRGEPACAVAQAPRDVQDGVQRAGPGAAPTSARPCSTRSSPVGQADGAFDLRGDLHDPDADAALGALMADLLAATPTRGRAGRGLTSHPHPTRRPHHDQAHDPRRVRDQIAAGQLISLGYSNVRKYAEGKQDWTEAGLELQSGAVAA